MKQLARTLEKLTGQIAIFFRNDDAGWDQDGLTNLVTLFSARSLPLDLAVKVQRGNGKRVLAMFSDPYCPACRQFEQALAQVDDITIYYFMYPVIRPELADHSRAVWCSPDRAKAWLELAANDGASDTDAVTASNGSAKRIAIS